VGAVYEEFVRELAGLRLKHSGQPRREMIFLCLLSLEREEIVSVAYREKVFLQRLASMPIPPEVRDPIVPELRDSIRRAAIECAQEVTDPGCQPLSRIPSHPVLAPRYDLLLRVCNDGMQAARLLHWKVFVILCPQYQRRTLDLLIQIG
jgi:hypothetical protein